MFYSVRAGALTPSPSPQRGEGTVKNPPQGGVLFFTNGTPGAGGIVVLISALLVLIFGIYPQPLFDIVQRARPLM